MRRRLRTSAEIDKTEQFIYWCVTIYIAFWSYNLFKDVLNICVFRAPAPDRFFTALGYGFTYILSPPITILGPAVTFEDKNKIHGLLMSIIPVICATLIAVVFLSGVFIEIFRPFMNIQFVGTAD